jgi:hypothetical protein
MSKEMVDGDGEVVVGRLQPRVAADDSVTIVVRIARERDVESLLQIDQPLHRVRRRGIHADTAIPIQRHEPERLVDLIADHREVELITIRDR